MGVQSYDCNTRDTSNTYYSILGQLVILTEDILGILVILTEHILEMLVILTRAY